MPSTNSPDPSVIKPPPNRHPGLDGLRGVAITSVVVYHLWPEAAKGAWLGVSLFFTLSGYLIIGRLDQEFRSTGQVRLGRFLERRIRRLLPAALLTAAGGLAIGAVDDSMPLRDVAADATASLTYTFNWWLMMPQRESNPLDGLPFDHFWSLSIEEQFYIFVPVLLLVVRKPVVAAFVMLAIGTAGVAVWWGSYDAYVATPARTFEIAAGAAFAVASARSQRVASFGQTTIQGRFSSFEQAIAASALACFSIATLHQLDPLTSRGAMPVVTVCWITLLAASLRGGALEPVMSLKPLRWLGSRSYAIYLFHYPLVLVSDSNPLIVIPVSLALAELSYRFLEMPFRARNGALEAGALFGAALLGTAVSASLAFL